jgi:hypothetical protein
MAYLHQIKEAKQEQTTHRSSCLEVLNPVTDTRCYAYEEARRS